MEKEGQIIDFKEITEEKWVVYELTEKDKVWYNAVKIVGVGRVSIIVNGEHDTYWSYFIYQEFGGMEEIGNYSSNATNIGIIEGAVTKEKMSECIKEKGSCTSHVGGFKMFELKDLEGAE